jgi:hypothetical protein
MCILLEDGQDDKADHDLDVVAVASPAESKTEESLPREKVIRYVCVL